MLDDNFMRHYIPIYNAVMKSDIQQFQYKCSGIILSLYIQVLICYSNTIKQNKLYYAIILLIYLLW